MKTASIPSLRVEPELRQEVGNALHDNETLSGFMEQALREQVRRRRLDVEFIARGLASGDKAKQTGEYYGADEVLAGLDTMLLSVEGKKNAGFKRHPPSRLTLQPSRFRLI